MNSEAEYQAALAALTSPMHRRFVEEYPVDFNGAAAARRAGYSQKTAASQASRLLTSVNVRRAIDARLSLLAMSADEALYRLAQHARGDLAPFLVEDPKRPAGTRIDLSTEQAKQAMALVKEVSIKSRVLRASRSISEGDDGEATTVEVVAEETVSIKLHDPQTALIKILQAHDRMKADTEVNVNVQPAITFYLPDNGRHDDEGD